jgi:hypothetical protein
MGTVAALDSAGVMIGDEEREDGCSDILMYSPNV